MDLYVKVAVVGAGYVGLVTAVCLAARGHTVTCIDKDTARIAALERAAPPFHEPGLEGLLKTTRDEGRFLVASTLEDGVRGAQAVIVAVGTPTTPDGRCDTTSVFAVVDQLRSVHEGDVVIRSTVPPGTGDALQQRAGQNIAIVNAPEFLAEGTAVRDFQEPDRVVLGGEPDAVDRLAPLFAAPPAPLIKTTRVVAEFAKYASNAFLAARVSLINDVAALCAVRGADVREVAKIVGLDGRIGPGFLRAGIGFGGSCFPKDVRALLFEATQAGIEAPGLEAALKTNELQRQRATDGLRGLLAGVDNPIVALWGVSFKPGTDDIREAPGLAIAAELAAEGVQVRYCDPVAQDAPEEPLRDPVEAARGADCVFHATEWPDFATVDPRRLATVMRRPMLFDGRNTLDSQAYREAGFRVMTVGGA